MSYFKRFLLLGSIGVVLLAGLVWTSNTQGSSTAHASGCNTVATGSWSNNCTVSEGNISNFVYAIQVMIDDINNCGNLNADGNFGSLTFAAVECYQKSANLSVDGIVGPQTWGSLYSRLKLDYSSGGWDYYHVWTNGGSYFRKLHTSGVWYVQPGWWNNSNNFNWCQVNLSSPCA